MPEINAIQKRLTAAGRQVQEAERLLYAAHNQLAARRKLLETALRRGRAGAEAAAVLQREIAVLEADLRERAAPAHDNARAELAEVVRSFGELNQPWQLVEQLNDDLPFLLFPVRVETRFMTVETGPELWVRIFPDDIAVETHEEALTEEEVEAGRDYWLEIWKAGQIEDPQQAESLKVSAWAKLTQLSDAARAAWVARRTKPESLDVALADQLVFPEFPPEMSKEDSWSQAARTRIMPDCFAVMGYLGSQQIEPAVGNPIPDPLIMGPDPLRLDDEFQQVDGDLQVGQEISWIYDFQAAVDVGMALRIPLASPFAESGFDRLLVLGVHLRSDKEESQSRVERLFESHHYAPDGMSLVPQGTPTNNTEKSGAGYSTIDPPAETSFEVEQGPVRFEQQSGQYEKRDGQLLAEALGIGLETLQRIRFADQRDMAEAAMINKALWPITLGYYLEQMLELDLATLGLVREFFADFVSGRGPLPALRVGTQPYGVLLTSDFSSWQWSAEFDRDRLPILNRMLGIARVLEGVWKNALAQVPRVGAPGDAHQNLLRMLGLHASSVEFYRRHAVGKGYTQNTLAFMRAARYDPPLEALLGQETISLLAQLGFDSAQFPRLFDLRFMQGHDPIGNPVVDDIPADQEERFSETRGLERRYRAAGGAQGETEVTLALNYIEWLLESSFEAVKKQQFEDPQGESLPVPRVLLYRMLRGALLQAQRDATLRLYASQDLLPVGARKEIELSNVREDRDVTSWEYMGADVSKVMPLLSDEAISVGAFVLTEPGLNLPEALSLKEVRECLQGLSGLPTARLERIFAEHIDLCSYRLDAWQTAFFNRRLQQQRFPGGDQENGEGRVKGMYLGAFGWLEDLRPTPIGAQPPQANLASLPVLSHQRLAELETPLIEKPDSGGFIHGPSLNHAVTAAVLRSAYLTHFDPAEPEKMAVNLSSRRVRTALGFLEGVRNGQSLGALLGYQFERGLREADPSLNQYPPRFRTKYPLFADKITPDEAGRPIESKEARNVFDGLALVEAVFLREPDEREDYPYGVPGLPPENSAAAAAIKNEVNRMAESFDAVADLALAEGVFQVAQGNFDRAGATLKAFTEGSNPIEPEIARTPRSGAIIMQRAVVHLSEGSQRIWTSNNQPVSQRAKIEAGLNQWLAERLPTPDSVIYQVGLAGSSLETKDLTTLGIEPIDLVYLSADLQSGEKTELEQRIAHSFRRENNEPDGEVVIQFKLDQDEPGATSLFELLPVLREMRDLITACRPLSAVDYTLSSEASSDETADSNPQGFLLGEANGRLTDLLDDFEAALFGLSTAIPLDADGHPDPVAADVEILRTALISLSAFGVPDAYPVSALGDSESTRRALLGQAVRMEAISRDKLKNARQHQADAGNPDLSTSAQVEQLRLAVRQVLGDSFTLIPKFDFTNRAEINVAMAFRDAEAGTNLTRHHQANPHIVAEWLQGIGRVREKMRTLEAVGMFGELLGGQPADLRPLQLPFRANDYWVAVEYPEPEAPALEGGDEPPVPFIPEGDFLSILQWLPDGGFQTDQPQGGLVVDEWPELIPSRQETTGIAVHYDQPNTEPPQTLLLAVSPQITGAWTWAKLVGILNDTLDRAQLRAVGPDQLDSSELGQILPAILTAVSSHDFGTVSTDLIHETAQFAIAQGSE